MGRIGRLDVRLLHPALTNTTTPMRRRLVFTSFINQSKRAWSMAERTCFSLGDAPPGGRTGLLLDWAALLKHCSAVYNRKVLTGEARFLLAASLCCTTQ